MGMRLAIDKQMEYATELVRQLSGDLRDNLAGEILGADQSNYASVNAQRERIKALRQKLTTIAKPKAQALELIADYLVRKNVWSIGGDGWAYDIGFGGLDHVLASRRDVNLLVLDTEVYSNTGGQSSKATPMGGAAKFAAAGKASFKKDLGRIAMSYGNVYVARVAFGAKDTQTVKAFLEAESYPGVSLIIAYAHCIAHGFDLAHGAEQQKLAVDSGYWPLYRFDPRLVDAGKNPLQLDSTPPKIGIDQFMHNETRFRIVQQQNAERYRDLLKLAQSNVRSRFSDLEELSKISVAPAASSAGSENGNGQ